MESETNNQNGYVEWFRSSVPRESLLATLVVRAYSIEVATKEVIGYCEDNPWLGTSKTWLQSPPQIEKSLVPLSPEDVHFFNVVSISWPAEANVFFESMQEHLPLLPPSKPPNLPGPTSS